MVDAALTATVDAGAVALSLTVENTGEEPVELAFSDGQRIDAVAERDGREVWQYADGRMFSMAVGSERLAPGDAVTFDAEWSAPPSGAFDVRAWLAATNTDASAETTVRVP